MQDRVMQAIGTISSVIYGKEHTVKLAVTCLLAKGHLLLEDLPGMGKTTLAHTLAHVFGLDYRRVQFTSDLLPADVLGSMVFEPGTGTFRFHAGPVFTQLLLADEVNRATAKTQSALLEAMEERQVSLDGTTRELPSPFFVIATQNPITQLGTYPLPESQLDRFLMRLSMGYPDAETERRLLMHGDTRHDIAALPACLLAEDLLALQQACDQVSLSDAVVNYVQRLAEASRQSDFISLGLSPRGALAVIQSAKAWAFLSGRDYLLPDDIQAVFPSVVSHRLLVRTELGTGKDPATELLSQVDVLQ